jgi:hypothetical protein
MVKVACINSAHGQTCGDHIQIFALISWKVNILKLWKSKLEKNLKKYTFIYI